MEKNKLIIAIEKQITKLQEKHSVLTQEENSKVRTWNDYLDIKDTQEQRVEEIFTLIKAKEILEKYL